ncbi:MAG: phosphoglucomutase/phosphomannomutase family protein [Oscillospiraceae bacterium]|nr:phosphoglucomutase/phosphomannomutase family protein [Oscillospiraceae bacterium]
MNNIKFGTGGWRAIIGDGFTRRHVQVLTYALCEKMKDDGVLNRGVIIGYDRRFLSDVAAFWAAEVFAAAGCPVRVIKHPAPTPLVMFAVKRFDLPYGMAVTASHNPAVYNGIKLFTRGGRDADEKVTAQMEEYIEKFYHAEIPVTEYAEGLKKGQISVIEPVNAYIDSILASIDTEAIRGAELNVVLDPMFGVSRTSLQTILMTARCNVDVIHERRDTLFGGRLPSPSAGTLDALRTFVIENGADIGIATDGDADRLGVIDERGRFLHPNEILVLLYYYLGKYKGWKGPVVRNLATTHLLDRVAEHLGETCYEVPVGFKHVSSKMLETDAVIGGESSGGLTVRGHIAGKDGIYAASLLVEMMAVTGRKLSEIYKEITDMLGEPFMCEYDYKFSADVKSSVVRLLMEDKKLPVFEIETERASYMDGCKVFFKNGGWLVARFSGTEPLIRIFCEMPDMELARRQCALMKEFLGV